MKINIGSTNPVKIQAVKEAFSEFSEFFGNIEIHSIKVESGVSEQPTSLKEIIKGAKNRAVRCFKNCNYSIGLEAGVFPVSETLTGYLNVNCCIVYNGKICGFGFSPGFEYPPYAIEEVKKGRNIEEIFDEMFNQEKTGQKQGAIGILTKGKFNRLQHMKYEVMMALLPLLNPELYKTNKIPI